MRREKTILDYPTISVNQAATVFMWSPRKFQQKFQTVLKVEIRHVKTSKGIRLLLEDVLRSAYPDAEEAVIYQLAYDYTMRDAIRRKETWGREARGKVRRRHDETEEKEEQDSGARL